MASAADGDGLRDLELIMDANLDSAFSSLAAPQSQQSQSQSEQQEEAEDEQAETEEVEKPASTRHHFVPCGNVASLSLALGTLTMPSLSSKVGVLTRGKPAGKTVLLPSQKKSQAPLPVLPSASAKLRLKLEQQLQLPAVSNKSAAASSTTAFPDYQMLARSGKSYGLPANGGAMKKAAIVWFRNDLRVHDNEALSAANKESLSVIPVYCFDPKDYGKSASGFDKTGPYRAKFLLDCVGGLRDSLRERGSDLVVRIGNPEEVLCSIAKSVGADGLFAHQEVSADEVGVEERVSASLKEQGVDVKMFWGSTLFHVDDLPFKVDDMPANYGGFRDKVKNVQVRPAAEAPKQMKGLPSQGDVKAGPMPSLQDLGLSPLAAAAGQDKHSPRGGALIGGEGEALKRLKGFSLDATPSKGKKISESSIYGANFSSKISPWLAMGCLSPRKMFEDLKKSTSRLVPQASATNTDSGMQWLVFELLWRDFFRFVTKKHVSVKRTQPAMACAV